MKKVLAVIVAVCLMSANTFAEDMSNMTDKEQADLAGAYVSEIIKYIKENYIQVKTENIQQQHK